MSHWCRALRCRKMRIWKKKKSTAEEGEGGRKGRTVCRESPNFLAVLSNVRRKTKGKRNDQKPWDEGWACEGGKETNRLDSAKLTGSTNGSYRVKKKGAKKTGEGGKTKKLVLPDGSARRAVEIKGR